MYFNLLSIITSYNLDFTVENDWLIAIVSYGVRVRKGDEKWMEKRERRHNYKIQQHRERKKE